MWDLPTECTTEKVVIHPRPAKKPLCLVVSAAVKRAGVAGFLAIFPDDATPDFFGDGNNHVAEKFALETAPKDFFESITGPTAGEFAVGEKSATAF